MKKQTAQSNEVNVPCQIGKSPLQVTDQEAVDTHEVRVRRVLDYQANSLGKEDALEANLGSINSGLMRVALWLDETIEQAIESGPRTVERLQGLLPAIDTHLRVTRQIDRFAQTELRAAESRRPRGNDAANVTHRIEYHPEEGINQSEDSEV